MTRLSGSKRRSGEVSLERALSKLGLASRTQARKLIEAGEVRVNGVVRNSPSFSVRPETARIEISGKLQESAPVQVWMLHKPRGVVTTRSDEDGRPTVFSLLKEEDRASHLVAVGRLDLATTGLLLLTNDTRLSAWLTDPKNGIPRTYLVTVRGEMTEEKARSLQEGILDQGELLKVSEVVLRKSSRRESHLTVTLEEGKNREIRRMFLALGHEVTLLKRVRFGALDLGSLKIGAYRALSEEEVRTAFPDADRKR